MKGKVGSAEFAVSIGGASKWSVRIDWMSEPLRYAQATFDELWQWLEINKFADWDAVSAARRYCHPMPLIDFGDGKTDPLTQGVGSLFFRSIERGEMDVELIRKTMPTLWVRLPKRRRDSGVPNAFLEAVLFLSALLACGEYAELAETVKRDTVDREAVAMHLYWLQRFYSLWSRTAASEPANRASNVAKRAAVDKWHEEFKKFRAGYLRRHPGAKVRTVVVQFLAPDGESHKSFRSLYAWALANKE